MNAPIEGGGAEVTNDRMLALADSQVFTSEECERLVDSGDLAGWQDSAISYVEGGERRSAVSEERRRAQSSYPPLADIEWATERLWSLLVQMNDMFYRFEISGFVGADPPFVTRYRHEDRGFLLPHNDIGRGLNSRRKLSFSVQLSEPDSYTGGDLYFVGPHQVANRAQGSVTVFPAFMTHEVTVVHAGTRHALIGWVHGPPFR